MVKTLHRIAFENLRQDQYKEFCKAVIPNKVANAYRFRDLSRIRVEEVIDILITWKLSPQRYNYWAKIFNTYAPAGFKRNLDPPEEEVQEELPEHAQPLVADTYSYAQKLDMYARHAYWCQVPPVHTTCWDKTDWIKHIDQTGGWKK